MLIRRVISAVALIGVIIATLFWEWLFNLAVIFFIVGGLYEFFLMLEQKGIKIYKYVGIGIGVVIPLSIIFHFEPTKSWELLFIVLALFSLILMQFRRRNSSGVIIDISTTLFGILYISWFFSFLIKIRQLPGGIGLLAGILFITKAGDIGAFLIGSRFGKRPLLPRISPKKSVEGALGGLLFSVCMAVACRPLLNFSWSHIVILGFCFGILGQLGDLCESLLKRDCNVKDSSGIFPGMGGVLDVIDSVLFTAPVFYFYMSVILYRSN
jgi:phosphatidate cytidylyltransferase